MSWFKSWWRRARPRLAPHQAARLAAWQALPAPSQDAALVEARWVVIDVEASGLDMRRDRLISIGAVALHGCDLVLADSFEVVLQQDVVSDDANILVHGIGGTAQRAGVPPVEALLAFLDYVGKSPLVAFHAAFDQAMIGRALRHHLGLRLFQRPLDLAYLAPALLPDRAHGRHTLDDWLSAYRIRDFARHQALSDAFSTAQLLQVLLAEALRQGITRCAELIVTERAQLELSRMQSMGS